MKFIPVKYKNKWLNPISLNRAYSLTKKKKATLFIHPVLGLTMKLKKKPLNMITVDNSLVVLGVDKGSYFDGFTIQSERYTKNYQFNHNRNVVKNISKNVARRIENRRLRRSRLRHRKSRFDNRIGPKMTKTCHYYVQHEINMINLLSEVYKVTDVVREDIRFNHWDSNRGRSFSNIEIGKNHIRNHIAKVLNLRLHEISGKETKKQRDRFFSETTYSKCGNIKYVVPRRVKSVDKGEKSFNAHCIDSFSMTLLIDSNFKLHDTDVVLINRGKGIKRRDIYQEKRLYNSKFNPYNNEYYRYAKGSIPIPFVKLSKLKKIRVKKSNNRSNHGEWEYHYTTPVPCYKKFKKLYGGRINRDGVIKRNEIMLEQIAS